MRTLVLYSRTPDDEYTEAFSFLYRELAKNGIDMFFCMPPDRLLGPGTFSGGWIIRDGTRNRVETPITADIIFNMSLAQFKEEDGYVINHPVFANACRKDETLKLFPELCPKSFLVKGESDLAAALKKLRTEIVVMKPTASFGGAGVWIGNRSAMPAAETFPIVLQEFIDTSGGIPGICEGRHDFRMMFFGSSLIHCYVRQPAAKVGYIANVALGGSIRKIPVESTPPGAHALAESVKSAFVNFTDSVYSIDMGLDRDHGWQLIELNSPPGLTVDKSEDPTETYIPLLAKHLATAKRTTNPTIVTA